MAGQGVARPVPVLCADPGAGPVRTPPPRRLPLPAPAPPSAPAAAPEVRAALDLIGRVLPGREGDLVCELIPPEGGREVLEVEGHGGRVVLRGSGTLALCLAFNCYLRRVAFADFQWLARGPLRLRRPLPRPAGRIRRVCAARERFLLNPCTYGYTLPWWHWSRWERFLDWMALNGVNRPLLAAGQERVWLDGWLGLPA